MVHYVGNLIWGEVHVKEPFYVASIHIVADCGGNNLVGFDVFVLDQSRHCRESSKSGNLTHRHFCPVDNGGLQKFSLFVVVHLSIYFLGGRAGLMEGRLVWVRTG